MGKILCDYCGTKSSDALSVRKNHLRGKHHQKLRNDYYEAIIEKYQIQPEIPIQNTKAASGVLENIYMGIPGSENENRGFILHVPPTSNALPNPPPDAIYTNYTKYLNPQKKMESTFSSTRFGGRKEIKGSNRTPRGNVSFHPDKRSSNSLQDQNKSVVTQTETQAASVLEAGKQSNSYGYGYTSNPRTNRYDSTNSANNFSNGHRNNFKSGNRDTYNGGYKGNRYGEASGNRYGGNRYRRY